MINAFRNTRVWTLALAATAMSAGLSAQQQPQQQPPQPTANYPAAGQAQRTDPYVVGQARPPVVEGTNVVDLSLEQAMAMALEKNLELKVARMNPSGVDYQLQSARAAFLPRYTATYGYSNTLTPSNDVLQGVATVSSLTQNFNAGAALLMPWHGASVSGNFTNNRNSTNTLNARLNPSFGSSVRLSYTQPLLAGWSMDNTRNQLRTLSVTRQIADITLLATIENTKASVRTNYWNLRSAIEQIEIQRRSLALARQFYEENKIKVEIGTAAPIDIVQPEAQVLNAEQQLLAAEVGWRTAELNFKRLIANGPDDEIYRATINPIEQAALSVQSVDIPGAVNAAVANRSDIVTTKRNLEISQLNLEVTKDLTKPNLGLTAGFNSTGQGGTRFSNGQVTEASGYWGALTNLTSLLNKGFSAQLDFTLPFGRDVTQNRVNYARAVLAIDQAQAQLKAVELNITNEVTNAGLAVENSYKLWQAAQKAREAADKSAEAEQTRFSLGMSTNYQVLDLQTRQTQQRLVELGRLINYLNAVAEFDRVQRVGR